jgi:carbamoyl-phosphate synthase large subunit
MNILITSAGQRVSLVNAFKVELKKVFPTGLVMTTDLNPPLSPACRISDKYFKVLPVNHKDYIQNLKSLCLDNRIKVVVPTIDTELQILADSKKEFLESGINIVVSEKEFVSQCRDKRLSNKFFLSKNIDIPEQFSPEHYKFPVFIKPKDGSLSRGIEVAYNEKELNRLDIYNENIMMMEFINPSLFSEFTVDAYYDRCSVLKCLVPRKRIQVRAGEVIKALTLKKQVYHVLKEKLSTINGAIGCLTIQVFYSESANQLIGIEINPRFGGGYPLSYLAGANYPKFIIDEYIYSKKLTFFDSWESNLLMLRYDAEILVNDFKE